MTLQSNYFAIKGQIKPKADWRAIDSPKKRTNEIFFCHDSPEILETWNFDFKFQVYSDCKAKKQNKLVSSVFGRIYGAPMPNMLTVLSGL